MFDFIILLAQDSGSWWDNLNPLKWIKSLTAGVYNGVKRFFCWVVLKGLTWAESFASYLLSWIPDSEAHAPGYMSDLLAVLAKANVWFPVDAFLWCITTYLMVCAAIAAIRFVKSWIPTLGG